MGSVLSLKRIAFQTLKSTLDDYETLSKRLSASPGIPELNPSIPYWAVPPSPIASHGKDVALPDDADIVIIGSGITGTSVAKALLEYERGDNTGPLNIIMIEARDACSGATGRNGGHMSPKVYNEYSELKASYGAEAAIKILQFRLAHIPALLKVAEEEGLAEESQARIVDDFDVFVQDAMFTDAKSQLDIFAKEVQEEGKAFRVLEDRDGIAGLQLSPAIVGCITKPGGAIHSYRFVTGVLANLISRYSSFQLYTHAPCTHISTSGSDYIVSTPRGDVKTRHIVHATNAWSSHLLPGMRRKIVPTRLHMTAQRPGQGLVNPGTVRSKSTPGTPESWTGKRAFVFYPGASQFAFDYLTQQLPSPSVKGPAKDSHYPQSAGEMMLGGGALLGGRAESALFDNIGVADDRASDFEVGAYLGGVLERYFADWGPEGCEGDIPGQAGEKWGKGRMKALWTGIMGMSADLQPWVGRVPSKISGRQEPVKGTAKNDDVSTSAGDKGLVLSGEWIAAGFTGEGMVHAWLSGKSLARMMLDSKETPADYGVPDLPPSFLITEKRWKQANIEDLMEGILSG